MRELLVDANLLIRFLAGDDPLQSPIATRLFEQAELGKVVLLVDAVVVAECVYVLTGARFKRTRAEAARVIGAALQNPGIIVRDDVVLADALARFGAKTVDFQDAWLAACASAAGKAVLSFDYDLDKFHDVTRVDPASL